MVRLSTGEFTPEGVMVQLVSEKNAVRTTVYTNEDGRYEFPKLETGSYALRIARPLEFKPYQHESVKIDGATQLEDIVLERITTRLKGRNTDSELLPPTPEIKEQLTGSEWLMNLPGTWEEKRRLNNTCGYGGCHEYGQLFSNYFDESGWRVIVNRMMRTRPTGFADMKNETARGSNNDFEVLVKFLARVRGPEAKDPPFKVLPRPHGVATRVIITEYELPRWDSKAHVAIGDSDGYLWYSSQHTPFLGKLDPRTGKVTEYRIPATVPGAASGSQLITWDNKRKVLWTAQKWAQQIIRFDPRTEKFTITQLPHDSPLNQPGVGDMGLYPDGSMWTARHHSIIRMDPETGRHLAKYPLRKMRGTYDNAFSDDGNFWCGGGNEYDGVACLNIQTGEVMEFDTPSPGAKPARGGFDPDGNAWFGSRGGFLIKVDVRKRRITEYLPPTPYVSFYECLPDKNGEIWAGELNGGRFLRFNPRTERWTEYVMPTPSVTNRKTWIDESTHPFTIWYVDHDGRYVRIQPLE